MIELVSVLSARQTIYAGLVDCEIVVTGYEGNPGETTLPFTWSRDDPYGLGPAVTGWFDVHPDFPVTPVDG